ncbi:MAG: serine hydrolase domain-containing protein [Sphingomonas sp.]
MALAVMMAITGDVLAVIVVPSAPAAAARVDPLPPAVAAYLDAQGQAGFSGVVLVARRGVVLTRAYGLADREFGIRNTPTTKFKIGSLTKQFTAAAILLLVEDGKLSLDDPLCRYVDPCPDAWRPIRIEQLLNHSSGIPDFVRLPGMRDRFTQPMKLADTVETLKREPLDFATGSDARYGNSGLLISAFIIEKLTGQSYAHFLDERIYRPLGMTASGYAADAPIIINRARGYVRRDGRFENAPFIDMSIPIGAGSQYSTVGDLYRWDRALYTDALLPKALRDRMFAKGKGDFGLGWEVEDENGRRVIEHNGDINGFGAFIARWPSEDATVIILANTEGIKVREMKDAIAARLFGK